MRLIKRNESPVGGWYYEIGELVIRAESPGLEPLERRVRAFMEANNISVPSDLRGVIEDQICQRQPAGRCRYEKNKAGDIVAVSVGFLAGIADKVAKAIGANPELKKRASGCKSCGRRRQTLNNLSR
jgi:hypothetical protein